MKTPRGEDLFRHIANEYADAYGAQLKEEQRALEQSGVTPVTPGLDRRVKELIQRKNSRRFVRIGATIAACLVLAVLTPFAMRQNSGNFAAQPDATPAAPSESAAQAEIAPDLSEEADAAPAYEILPLSFALPEQFAVDHVELDRAQSVYYLSDEMRDDVVMRMELTPMPVDPQQYTLLEIGGYPTYVYATGDYNLMTFSHDGILYELSCRYDINTLVTLGESILL